MKKIITLFLAIILLLSITACSSELDEESSYVYAKNEQNAEEKEEKETETETERIIKYCLACETNGGTQITPRWYEEGWIINSVPVTTSEGNLFDGWFLDQELTIPVAFPLTMNKNITIYAKWLSLTDTKTLEDIQLKDWGNNAETFSAYITPDGFDMNKLSSLSYKMDITVSYTVRYKKDYDALLDIGYMGAPKYDVSLINSDGEGDIRENIKTSKSATSKTISYSDTVSNLKNDKIKLIFSTENIQNIIYIEDITITYNCTK